MQGVVPRHWRTAEQAVSMVSGELLTAVAVGVGLGIEGKGLARKRRGGPQPFVCLICCFSLFLRVAFV